MSFLSRISRFFNRKAQAPRLITIGNNLKPGTTITLASTQRFGVGIDDYIRAVRAADSIDYSRRAALYDIYADIATDAHVQAVVQKRRSGVLASPVEFRRGGVPDDAVNEQLRSPWFLRFLEDAIDSRLWGFTLVQFYRNDQGWIDYDLIPRKHVNLIDRQVMARQSDLQGIPFDAFDNLLLIRDKEDLGRYLSLCPWVIWKRQSAGDWAQFSELFGMPVRKYTYDAADPDALSAAVQAASEQGGAAVFFCPTGTSLELIESGSASASSDLYASRIDRCNAEISKAILGNTLTTEASDTGTQALGTIHAQEEDELSKQDRQMILNLLNYDMTDIFARLGIDTHGGEFVYAETEKTTPHDRQQALRTLMVDLGLPVDPDVIYETFGVERPTSLPSVPGAAVLGGNLSPSEDPAENPPAGVPGAAVHGGKNTAPPQNRTPFFVQAPPRGAQDLDW